jgi:hypothetical protein
MKTMDFIWFKRILLSVMVWFMGHGINAQAAETHAYVGAVGEQAAVFKLAWEVDGSVFGSYFCPGGSGKVYTLVGSNAREGELILKEFTPGKKLATATCKLTKRIENGKIVWRGIMQNHDGRTKSMFFYRDRN